jgi:dUTP pyrophosphatase
LAIEIPEGYGGFLFARSGLACKEGLAPANKVGVIDPDYRGEFIVALHNHTSEEKLIMPKMRIAQLAIIPCVVADIEEVDNLSETNRGDGGFGSTGR